MLIGIVPLHQVAQIWGHAAPFILKAMAEGPPTHTLEDFKAEILAEKSQLWFGVANNRPILGGIGQVRVYPRMSAYHMIALGASDDAADWFDHFRAALEAVARALDCKAIAATGRMGWARRFKAPYLCMTWKEV